MKPSGSFMNVAAITLFAACVSNTAWAQSAAQDKQTFPDRPITIVVPYPPGGGSDGIIRQIADFASKRLDQSVVVQNRPGANTMLGTDFVARQPGDGYTLLYADSSLTSNPALYEVRHSPKDDFTPITLIMSDAPLAVSIPLDSPYKTFGDLLAYAKDNPGAITYGTWGLGSRGHLVGEMLSHKTKVELLHVPYKGSAAALNGILTKDVDFSLTPLQAALPLIKSGQAKVLSVIAQGRLKAVPDIPAVNEYVPGFSPVGWAGIFAPKNTDPHVVKILADVINEAVQQPAIRDALESQGASTQARSSEYISTLIATEVETWAQLVKEANLTFK